jgi:hypothetical protein
MSTVTTDKLTQLLNSELGYNEPNKKAFHKEAKKVLKEIVSRLGLAKSDYDITVNKSGVACSGDVKLKTDKFSLSLSEGTCGSIKQMYRTCNGRKDTTGGVNQWVEPERLLDDDIIERFARFHG